MPKDAVQKRLIIGLGATGLATARYCQRRGWDFDIHDSREAPPGLDRAKAEFPAAELTTGDLLAEYLCEYDQLIVSPGVPLATPGIAAALQHGVDVVGDVELFLQNRPAPIIAITGSNGKSTVTTLVCELLECAGKRVRMGGNIGIPVLDLLAPDTPPMDFCVLELSSFQLETTHCVDAEAATMLNLSEDHMDRYDGMGSYLKAKQRVFSGCNAVVVNLDDAASTPVEAAPTCLSFGLFPSSGSKADRPNYVLKPGEHESGEAGYWIVRDQHPLIHSSSIGIKGLHNLSNVMAALALVDAVGVDVSSTLPALASFQGLSHRCQFVERVKGVDFINDSKGTNVGSTCAAIEGFGSNSEPGRLWLLLGGDGKGQDFSPLVSSVRRCVAGVFCFGQDANRLMSALNESAECRCFETLDESLNAAMAIAQAGDTILLSPACASLDQFPNYIERGLYFESLVRGRS